MGGDGDGGFDHPLSPDGHAEDDDDDYDEGAVGNQRTGYAVSSPNNRKSFLEDQWRGNGNGNGNGNGIGNGNGYGNGDVNGRRVQRERMDEDRINKHPFANGNGNQTNEYQTIESKNNNQYQLESHPPPTKSFSKPSHQKIRHRNADLLNRLPLQSTTYYFNGLLQTGGDSPLPLVGSIVLVLGLGGLWLGTTGVWMWRNGFGGGGPGVGGKVAVVIFGYLMGIVISSMMMTAFRDPGRFRFFFSISLSGKMTDFRSCSRGGEY